MKRTPVESININSVGFEINKNILEIQFNNGSIYQYFDVPQHIYISLMSAESHGSYFETNVRNIYTYQRIDNEGQGFLVDNKITFSAKVVKRKVYWNQSSWKNRLLFTFDKIDSGRINKNAFSPDSTMLAASSGLQILIWDTRNWNLLFTINVESEIGLIAFDPKGRFLAGALDNKGKANFWRLNDGKLIHSIDTGIHFNSLCISPDGENLIAFSSPCDIGFWRIQDGRLLKSLEVQFFNNFVISPDGKLLANGGCGRKNDSIWIWDIEKNIKLLALDHEAQVDVLVFSPDNQILASGSCDGYVRIWNVIDGKLLNEIEFKIAKGVRVFSSSVFGEISYYGPEDYRSPKYLAFNPDGTILAVGGGGYFCLFRVEDGHLLLDGKEIIKGWEFAFSPDWRLFVNANDHRVEIRNMEI